MLVENHQQFVLVDGDKVVEGLLTVISHTERVMHVFHNSVQLDEPDLSVAHSMYVVSEAISQQAQENRVMIRETVVSSMGVLYNCVLWSREDKVEGVSPAMCCITHMLHQAKPIKEVVKLDRIFFICLVNVNIEDTEKHKLFRCCDM